MQFAFPVLPKVLDTWVTFLLSPQMFHSFFALFFNCYEYLGEDCLGQIEHKHRELQMLKRCSEWNCRALSSWLTAVKAADVLMCACAVGKKWEIRVVGSSSKGEKWVGRREGERAAAGGHRGAKGERVQGPGEHRGRDAACQGFLPACGKGIGDERTCKVFQYSRRLTAGRIQKA